MIRKLTGKSLTSIKRSGAIAAAAALAATGLMAVASPAFAAGPTVGVLPSVNGVCPSGTAQYWVYEDNEDKNNANSRSGWLGGITSNSNTKILLCAVDGTIFTSLKNNYRVNFATLALGPTCPSGALTVDRYVDDEDDNNQSASSVPSGSGTGKAGGNTNLRFCWFLNYDTAKPVPTNANFPALSGSYGVFGTPGGIFGNPFISYGTVHTDDEDSDNRNSRTALDSTLTFYCDQWLEAGSNTTLHLVQVR